LHVIDDPRLWDVAVAHGLYCGFQCSVIRRSLFADPLVRRPYTRLVGEDVAVIMRAIKAGCRFGYLDAVHTVYRVHGENVSTPTGGGGSWDKQVSRSRDWADGIAEASRELDLSRVERRATNRLLAATYFWQIGYALLWQHGRRDEALAEFRRGLRLRPWCLPFWKTYAVALIRTRLAGG
jgi:hypothetical protein